MTTQRVSSHRLSSQSPPAKEAQLQDVKQAGEDNSVPEQHGSIPSVRAEARQLAVVLEPEPAEHLDHEGRQDHEADQDPEPGDVTAAVELRGHPHVGAPVHQKSAHSDHGEGKVDPGVVEKRRSLHVRFNRGQPRQRETCCWEANIRLTTRTVISLLKRL